MRTLELFAGLGGLKLAAPTQMTVVAAYDQDAAAAAVHEAWHGVPACRIDLASVSAGELTRHDAEAWLLSPPCQPFTQRGRRRDVDDPRCGGLLRLIDLLAVVKPRRLLLENVPGFHGSRAHGLLVEALRSLSHDVRDVVACPTELGTPMRRLRHFVVSSADGLSPLPDAQRVENMLVTDFLDEDVDDELVIPSSLRAKVDDHLPVVGRDGVLGTFTRSYGRAINGAGPVHWDDSGPRFFSPGEILRLHGFPADFAFPRGLSLRTRWRLAGNSVHVPTVRRVAATLVPSTERHAAA